MPSDGDRPAHQDDLLLQHLRNFLGIIDEAAIDKLRGRLRWLQLAGGETLMRQGEPGDELYLLVSGRLRVYVEEDEQRRIVREVTRGAVVGEMGLIAEAPRSATVVAIRDSVLVSLGKADFAELQATSPQVTLALTRQIIERLRTERGPTVADRPVTMAVLPVSAGVDAGAFAHELAAQLASRGRVVVLGPTGRNFAAGMSGGIAYVLDLDDTFQRRCNHEMVDLEPVDSPEDIDTVVMLIRRHVDCTGSELGARVLASHFAVNCIRPAVGERFVAKAKVVRAGRQQVFTHCELYAHDQGDAKLVATGETLLCVVAEPLAATP